MRRKLSTATKVTATLGYQTESQARAVSASSFSGLKKELVVQSDAFKDVEVTALDVTVIERPPVKRSAPPAAAKVDDEEEEDDFPDLATVGIYIGCAVVLVFFVLVFVLCCIFHAKREKKDREQNTTNATPRKGSSPRRSPRKSPRTRKQSVPRKEALQSPVIMVDTRTDDYDIDVEVTSPGSTTPEVQDLVKSAVRDAVYSKRPSDLHLNMRRMPSDLENSKTEDSTIVISEELEEDHLIV